MRKNERFKQARIKSGLSQVQLAEQMGLKQSYISKLENGDSFSYEQAERIAEILGVRPADIIPNEQNYNEYSATVPEYESDLVKSLRDIIKSKDETILILKDQVNDLKHRLSTYEDPGKDKTA